MCVSYIKFCKYSSKYFDFFQNQNMAAFYYPQEPCCYPQEQCCYPQEQCYYPQEHCYYPQEQAENHIIFSHMTEFERDIVRVAGNSSNVWRLHELNNALRANNIEMFGSPGGLRNLANFIRKRDHIFNFDRGIIWTRFASIDSLPSSTITNVNLPENIQRKFDSARESQVQTTYIVIDTNVWISELKTVFSLIEDPKYENYSVYVPWMVLQELDSLKNSPRRDVFKAARKATNHLLELFDTKNKRICGQSGMEAKDAEKYFQSENEDDKILQACMQLKSQEKVVKLCTLDKNMVLKAHTLGIEIFKCDNGIKLPVRKRSAPIGKYK